jgi:predicted transcriptional regulator
MEEIVLFESELKVMEILWKEGKTTAKEVSLHALQLYEWNKNTTYTILKKLINKNAVKREEPNFMCEAIITKEQVQRGESRKLVDKLYDGSSQLLVSSFIKDEKLSRDDLESLRDLIDKKL